MDNIQFIKKAKKLARLGPRGVYGQSLLECQLDKSVFDLSRFEMHQG